MAYPTVSAPYGLVPVRMVDGSPYNGAVRAYKINSGSTDVIFNGDVVDLGVDGYIDREAFDDDMDYVGVFVGCSYTDPTYGLTFRNYYPGSITADDITAYVVDSANVLFKVAVVDNSGAMSYVTQASLQANIGGQEGASANGSTATGRSNAGVDSSTDAATATLPFRIVDFVEETKTSDGYVEVLVKFNDNHWPSSTTGIALS